MTDIVDRAQRVLSLRQPFRRRQSPPLVPELVAEVVSLRSTLARVQEIAFRGSLSSNSMTYMGTVADICAVLEAVGPTEDGAA